MLAHTAFAASALTAATILVPAVLRAETFEVRYSSTVIAVNAKTNTLTFADHSQAIVDKSIPVTTALVGKAVEIGTEGDEDGNAPARLVRVVN